MLVFHYSPFLLHSTTTSLYTDCSNNLYAGLSSYLLILFSALSAFAVGGLSIERNQKPLAPEITLAVTHHDRQKQVEVKRSSRVKPHEIRLFSGCPYYFTLPFTCNNVQSPYIRFLGHSIQHKERIGSYTCPLAVTPPSWSRFLSVRHFCLSERSFVHSSGKKI